MDGTLAEEWLGHSGNHLGGFLKHKSTKSRAVSHFSEQDCMVYFSHRAEHDQNMVIVYHI